MLSLLETGQALYVLAGICVLGILTRLATRNLYKRLAKESTNLAAAKNKSLKELRQRAENAYRINQGMRDTGSWLEHQIGELRFRGMTLAGWTNLSVQMTWLCLMAGGLGAFFSYWYRLDTYYVVMYGGGAVLMAMLTMFFDGSISAARRDQLLASLQDYLENSMFPRLERFSDRGGIADRAGYMERSGHAARVSALERSGEQGTVSEPAIVPDGETHRGGGDFEAEEPAAQAAAPKPLTSRRLPPRNRRRETPVPVVVREQTAAAAAPPGPKEPAAEKNWLKELGPEEARVIGDILKQYLT